MKHYDILKMKSYYNYFYLNLFEKEIETSWICGNEKFIWFTYMTEKMKCSYIWKKMKYSYIWKKKMKSWYIWKRKWYIIMFWEWNFYQIWVNFEKLLRVYIIMYVRLSTYIMRRMSTLFELHIQCIRNILRC